MNWGNTSYSFRETRSYNSRLQLTRQTAQALVGSNWVTDVDLEYRFSATQNNGQITQFKDWMTGEEVTYAYDSLSRLISASTTGPEWGQSYGYDGFGNRTSVTVTEGTAPAGSLTIDPMTNRITNAGFSYDANGNLAGHHGGEVMLLLRAAVGLLAVFFAHYLGRSLAGLFQRRERLGALLMVVLAWPLAAGNHYLIQATLDPDFQTRAFAHVEYLAGLGDRVAGGEGETKAVE